MYSMKCELYSLSLSPFLLLSFRMTLTLYWFHFDIFHAWRLPIDSETEVKWLDICKFNRICIDRVRQIQLEKSLNRLNCEFGRRAISTNFLTSSFRASHGCKIQSTSTCQPDSSGWCYPFCLPTSCTRYEAFRNKCTFRSIFQCRHSRSPCLVSSWNLNILFHPTTQYRIATKKNVSSVQQVERIAYDIKYVASHFSNLKSVLVADSERTYLCCCETLRIYFAIIHSTVNENVL